VGNVDDVLLEKDTYKHACMKFQFVSLFQRESSLQAVVNEVGIECIDNVTGEM